MLRSGLRRHVDGRPLTDGALAPRPSESLRHCLHGAKAFAKRRCFVGKSLVADMWHGRLHDVFGSGELRGNVGREIETYGAAQVLDEGGADEGSLFVTAASRASANLRMVQSKPDVSDVTQRIPCALGKQFESERCHSIGVLAEDPEIEDSHVRIVHNTLVLVDPAFLNPNLDALGSEIDVALENPMPTVDALSFAKERVTVEAATQIEALLLLGHANRGVDRLRTADEANPPWRGEAFEELEIRELFDDDELGAFDHWPIVSVSTVIGKPKPWPGWRSASAKRPFVGPKGRLAGGGGPPLTHARPYSDLSRASRGG